MYGRNAMGSCWYLARPPPLSIQHLGKISTRRVAPPRGASLFDSRRGAGRSRTLRFTYEELRK
jgi:hypothetical protein